MTSEISTPRISVLLTSYNREQYIGEAIDSVLAQTVTDFELIVSDDCSTDGTLAIVNDYARRDARIRVSVNERNLGDYGNRRQVASLARGRFLKYHDSDDVMYPHCLAAMIEPLEREPRAAFALSAAGYWPGGACPMLLTPQQAYEREFLGSGLFQLGPASALFRAEAFRELGGFPLDGVASDYLFWIKACARVCVLLVPGNLYYYRTHAGQEAAKPTGVAAYSRAAAEAWRMLKSPQCPLAGESLEIGKSNFVYTQARGMYRQIRRGQFQAALTTGRLLDIGLTEWLTYLRRPRRSASAGTPAPAGRTQR